MSDITRWKVSGPVTRLQPDADGPWVALVDYYRAIDRLIAERDEARGEVERVKQERDDHRAEFERLVVERDDHRFEVEQLTAELTNAKIRHSLLGMKLENAETLAGREEYDRLFASFLNVRGECDSAQVEASQLRGEVERLTNEVNAFSEVNERIIDERDEALAEVERLKAMLPPTAHTGVRNGPGEGSWSVFAGKVAEERDEAREEVERLKAEVKRLMDELGVDFVEIEGLKNAIDFLTHERNDAQVDVERLKEQIGALTLAVEQADEMKAHAEAAAAREEAETDRVVADGNRALAEVERLTIELNDTREKLARVQVQYDEFAKVTAKVIDQHQRERDDARQQVYLLQQAGADRPDDETIWREAFMSQLHDRYWASSESADAALAEYRKRWPR